MCCAVTGTRGGNGDPKKIPGGGLHRARARQQHPQPLRAGAVPDTRSTQGEMTPPLAPLEKAPQPFLVSFVPSPLNAEEYSIASLWQNEAGRSRKRQNKNRGVELLLHARWKYHDLRRSCRTYTVSKTKPTNVFTLLRGNIPGSNQNRIWRLNIRLNIRGIPVFWVLREF